MIEPLDSMGGHLDTAIPKIRNVLSGGLSGDETDRFFPRTGFLMVSDTAADLAQKAAEADVDQFRRELGPFVVAAEKTRMAMLFTNAKVPNNPIIFANESFLSLTGYARHDTLGHSFTSLMANRCDAEGLASIEASFVGKEGQPEIRFRSKDGDDFWATIFVTPVTDEHGEVVQHFVSLHDVTKHKAEQAHCKMLVDELNHRVRNTLATVQSIVRQALRKTSDSVALKESIESRLLAISRSHELLTNENWKPASLRDVICSALDPFVSRGSERVLITGVDVRLPPKTALALGSAFNELATNALKFGALSNDTGSVSILWGVQSSRLLLCWQ